jgi:hypothetical protein
VDHRCCGRFSYRHNVQNLRCSYIQACARSLHKVACLRSILSCISDLVAAQTAWFVQVEEGQAQHELYLADAQRAILKSAEISSSLHTAPDPDNLFDAQQPPSQSDKAQNKAHACGRPARGP